jgi:hypothetical protein
VERAPDALRAAGPLLDPARLAIVGSDPRETDDAGRRFVEDADGSLINRYMEGIAGALAA